MAHSTLLPDVNGCARSRGSLTAVRVRMLSRFLAHQSPENLTWTVNHTLNYFKMLQAASAVLKVFSPSKPNKGAQSGGAAVAPYSCPAATQSSHIRYITPIQSAENVAQNGQTGPYSAVSSRLMLRGWWRELHADTPRSCPLCCLCRLNQRPLQLPSQQYHHLFLWLLS